MSTKFVRKGKTIKNIDTGEVTDFKSVNKAKKESRSIQMRENGGLGLGSVMVSK